MRRPIASKSERSGTGVDMANLSKAVCHGESDKCRFGNPPQESNSQRLGINPSQKLADQGLFHGFQKHKFEPSLKYSVRADANRLHKMFPCRPYYRASPRLLWF